MKIYAKTPHLILKLSDVPDKLIYHIFTQIGDTSFKLSMFKRSESQDVILDEVFVDLNDYKGRNSIFEVCHEKTNKYSQVIDFDYISSGRTNSTAILPVDRSSDNFIVNIPYSSISFYCPSSTGDNLIFVNAPVYFDKIEPVAIDPSIKFFQIILEQYPLYKNKLELIYAKRNLLINLDPNNSLSYIEAQLDFVTKMLLSIIETTPEFKTIVLDRVKEYSNFKYIFEQSNVFTVKNEHDCYNEIKDGKPLVRQYQANYIANKQVINNME